jgi:hypothetical protein
MRALIITAACMALLPACASESQEQTGVRYQAIAVPTLQRIRIEAAHDAYISEGAKSQNFGSSYRLRAGAAGDTAPVEDSAGVGRKNVLIKWNLSALPAAPPGYRLHIQSVSLRMVQTDSAVIDDEFRFYRASGSWTESTVNWNSGIGAAQLLFVADLPSSAVGDGVFHITNHALRDLVQGWVDGTFPNHGLKITPYTYWSTSLDGDTLASKEHTDPEKFGPTLDIEYFVAEIGQATVVPSDDAFVSQGAPNTNFGNSFGMRIGGSGDDQPPVAGTGVKRALIRWDFSALEASIVTDATLRLRQTDGSVLSSPYEFVNAMDVCDPQSQSCTCNTWKESSVTWNNWRPSASHCDGSEEAQEVFLTASLPSNQTNGGVFEYSGASLPVQDWIDLGPTYLLIRQSNESIADGDHIAASEQAVGPPELDVDYYLRPEPWTNLVVTGTPDTPARLVASPSLASPGPGVLIAAYHCESGTCSGKSLATRALVSRDNGMSWHAPVTLGNFRVPAVFAAGGRTFIIGLSKPNPGDDGFHLAIQELVDTGTGPLQTDDTERIYLHLHHGGKPDRFQKGSTPVVEVGGRLYHSVEDLEVAQDSATWPEPRRSYLVSVEADPDEIMDASAWSFSNGLLWEDYDLSNQELAELNCLGSSFPCGTLEGNAVEGPDGEVYAILRVDRSGADKTLGSGPIGKAIVLKLDQGASCANPGGCLDRHSIIDFPGGQTKFTIHRYPAQNGLYYSLVNNVTDTSNRAQRNVLSLAASPDLASWRILRTVLTDGSGLSWERSMAETGFQYADWVFSGNEILYVSRTALGRDRISEDRADRGYHDAHRITFHREPMDF